MPGETDTSPRIEALRHDVERGEQRAVERFWAAVTEEGTPLVEPLRDDGNELLVTFVWRGDAGTRNVRVLADDLLGKTAAENAMSRLLETDVWFKTYRLPATARFEDLVSPDDRELGGNRGERWQDNVATWQPDPLNPKQYLIPNEDELPDWGDFFGPWSTWVKPVNSLAELPGAPPQPWAIDRTDVAKGRVDGHRLKSEILGNDRRVYVYTPPGYEAPDEPPGLLLLSDGWLYHTIIPVPRILDNLVAEKAVRALMAVMVSHPSLADRNSELSYQTPQPPFLAFVTNELLPWLHATYSVTADPSRSIVAGASNGGDFAALTAFRHPELFRHVLSQSGTFARSPEDDAEPEWLARQLAKSQRLPLRFYLEAGSHETDGGRSGVSILTSNRQLRNVLRAKGYPLEHREYTGGHQPLVWRGTLGQGLIWLTGGS